MRNCYRQRIYKPCVSLPLTLCFLYLYFFAPSVDSCSICHERQNWKRCVRRIENCSNQQLFRYASAEIAACTLWAALCQIQSHFTSFKYNHNGKLSISCLYLYRPLFKLKSHVFHLLSIYSSSTFAITVAVVILFIIACCSIFGLVCFAWMHFECFLNVVYANLNSIWYCWVLRTQSNCHRKRLI